jgi:hypothetical protein
MVTAGFSSPAGARPFGSDAGLRSGTVVGSYANAGALTGWGTAGSLSLPASLEGVAVESISMGTGWALARTATGKIVTWGADSTMASALPSSAAGISQLSASGTNAAAAVTSDGHVVAWFGGSPSVATAWLDTSGLTDVAAIALGQHQPYGVALTKAGTVKTWGVDSGSGKVTSPIPATLTDVVDVAACDDTALALTSDGGVHAWGSDADGLVSDAPAPAAGLQQVVAIACAGHTGVALRQDGSVTEWGDTSGVNAVPASLTAAFAGGVRIRAIDASSGGIVAWAGPLDAWAWGGPTLVGAAVPSEAKSGSVSEFAPGSDGVYALVPAVLVVRRPTITGTAVPGKTISADPAFFSGNYISSGQWYRDGAPIDGATTVAYHLQPSDVGKALTYRSTALDPQDPSVTLAVAESDPVTVGPADSASTVTVTPHLGNYGHASSVTVHVSSPAGASGRVSLSVDGARASTATLSHGSASFRLPAKLAAGPHMVGATYEGNSTSSGATGWATLTVAKATSHTKVTLPKKAHHGGKVRVTVKVRTSGGRATGMVTVKIGKAKGYASVVHGKAVVRLKVAKMPHKQKVVAIYSGDNNVRGSRAHARLTVR